MKTTITQEDLEKAQAEFAAQRGERVTNCCLVFQACKRNGIPVVYCGLRSIQADGQFFQLPESCHQITNAREDEWPLFVGREIELPDLPPAACGPTVSGVASKASGDAVLLKP